MTYEVERTVLIAQLKPDAPIGELCVYGSPNADASEKVKLSPNAGLGGLLSCDLRGHQLVGDDPFDEIELYFGSNSSGVGRQLAGCEGLQV